MVAQGLHIMLFFFLPGLQKLQSKFVFFPMLLPRSQPLQDHETPPPRMTRS